VCFQTAERRLETRLPGDAVTVQPGHLDITRVVQRERALTLLPMLSEGAMLGWNAAITAIQSTRQQVPWSP
jgi:hypothetical protein